MEQLAKQNGGSLGNVGKLNNMLMQMRKNCNHPDLITSAFSKHRNGQHILSECALQQCAVPSAQGPAGAVRQAAAAGQWQEAHNKLYVCTCAHRSDVLFPPPEVLLGQCGKLQLLDRLLKELQARKHKVLIFSQVGSKTHIIEHIYNEHVSNAPPVLHVSTKAPHLFAGGQKLPLVSYLPQHNPAIQPSPGLPHALLYVHDHTNTHFYTHTFTRTHTHTHTYTHMLLTDDKDAGRH
eukprot:385443-Pelagomonas_calceolata.AAC.6